MTAVVTPTIVGALACQRNPFLKTFQTKVALSLEYVPPLTSKEKQNRKDKEPREKKYAVELEDTIFFPEGGGQPYDTGSIVLPDESKVAVNSVLRDKLKAVHITDLPIPQGTQVSLKIDWERRLDLMQQHTGQHLLSAVFDTYKLETLSWSMGEMVNYIELPEKVSDEIVEEVLKKVNDLIMDSIPITVANPDSLGREIDVSHIPEDYDLSKGIVRIVRIGDIDANPCCGTHLQSTAQIQAITILHQTNVRGGHSRLHFLCGSRVYKYLREQSEILRNVGSQLSCKMDEVTDKVALLNTNYRRATSREQSLLKELASIEAMKVFEGVKNGATHAVVYRKDNPEYLTLVQKELTNLGSSAEYTLTLISGEAGSGGMVKISGPKASEISETLKQKISTLKGGGKGNSFQGKVVKFSKSELEASLEYLNSLNE